MDIRDIINTLNSIEKHINEDEFSQYSGDQATAQQAVKDKQEFAAKQKQLYGLLQKLRTLVNPVSESNNNIAKSLVESFGYTQDIEEDEELSEDDLDALIPYLSSLNMAGPNPSAIQKSPTTAAEEILDLQKRLESIDINEEEQLNEIAPLIIWAWNAFLIGWGLVVPLKKTYGNIRTIQHDIESGKLTTEQGNTQIGNEVENFAGTILTNLVTGKVTSFLPGLQALGKLTKSPFIKKLLDKLTGPVAQKGAQALLISMNTSGNPLGKWIAGKVFEPFLSPEQIGRYIGGPAAELASKVIPDSVDDTEKTDATKDTAKDTSAVTPMPGDTTGGGAYKTTEPSGTSTTPASTGATTVPAAKPTTQATSSPEVKSVVTQIKSLIADLQQSSDPDAPKAVDHAKQTLQLYAPGL